MNEPIYSTPYGEFTFAEFHNTTRPLAAHVLRHRFNMRDEQDIDDCLQIAYLKIWQQLQRDPRYLADKSLHYLMTFIGWNCKAQRYAHHRHYNKVQIFNRRTSVYPRRSDVDLRIDLTAAIQDFVGKKSTRLYLAAFYFVTTNVSADEAATAFNCAPKTIYKYARWVKTELKKRLPHYE
jgi:hypothetical protein